MLVPKICLLTYRDVDLSEELGLVRITSVILSDELDRHSLGWVLHYFSLPREVDQRVNDLEPIQNHQLQLVIYQRQTEYHKILISDIKTMFIIERDNVIFISSMFRFFITCWGLASERRPVLFVSLYSTSWKKHRRSKLLRWLILDQIKQCKWVFLPKIHLTQLTKIFNNRSTCEKVPTLARMAEKSVQLFYISPLCKVIFNELWAVSSLKLGILIGTLK